MRHPGAGREIDHGRQHRAVVRRFDVLVERSAKSTADFWVILVEELRSADVDRLYVLQEARKARVVPARRQHQRADFSLQAIRVIGHRGGALDLRPLGSEKIRRQNHDQILAVVDALLQRDDPVFSLFDRLLVEETGHAITCETPE